MSWHTKEDVLDDLVEVMGNGINEFDDQYILRGEQPPPPACSSNEIDDDELYLRLQGDLGHRTMNEDCRGPDLSGITEMLRMVEKFHSTSITENNQLYTQNSSSNGISITKLNLNVPDFVPKTDINYVSTNIDRLCSEQTMDQAKTKEISDKLKSKIGSSYKTNNFKMKPERNLAIASLLKLHSKEESVADESIPKLITPEHFQQNSSAKFNNKSSQSSLKQLIPVRNLLQTEKVESPVEITEEARCMGLELEESMAKVNNWLNKGSDKQKLDTRGPTVHLGPVTFRKKEIKEPKTPNSEVSDKSNTRMTDDSFIPSEFAEKLTQSYMERVKAKEDKSLDIWDKLERNLKIKDQEILSKSHQQHKQSSEEKSIGSQS